MSKISPMEKIHRLGLVAHNFFYNLTIWQQRQADRWYDGLTLLACCLVIGFNLRRRRQRVEHET